MSEPVCRWGFLSAAAISRKNWKSIAFSRSGVLVAVASRGAGKAQQFIDECQAEVPFATKPDALTSYEELLARPDIDAVYIALPTALRKEWVIRAAEAGKHVLCEKPIAVTTADAQDMLAACERHRVQFMDGVMFNHGLRLPAMRQSIDGPEGIGSIHHIASHFSFCGGPEFERDNIRVQSQLEPHGCLGDLGWYNLRFSLWAMNYKLPTSVVAHTHHQLRGVSSVGSVPGELSGTLFFDGGVSASFFCSFKVENQQTASISGDRGYLSLDDFALPKYGTQAEWKINRNVIEIFNCRWNVCSRQTRYATDEYAAGEANSQEVNMIRAMNHIVLTGQLDPFWPEISLKTQRVLDACRQSADLDGQRVTL